MERKTEGYGMRRHYSSRGAVSRPRFLWNDFCIAADLTGDGTVSIRFRGVSARGRNVQWLQYGEGFMYLWSSWLGLGN